MVLLLLVWSRSVTRHAEKMNCATVLERDKDSG